MSLTITLIPVYRDNYAYLIQSAAGDAAIVDPGEAKPVLDYISAHNIKLSYILNTHHHWDHTTGNKEVANATGAKIVGPAAEEDKIGKLDIGLKDGDVFDLFGYKFNIIHTPGHTHGHICFYCADEKIIFTGDTLFSMGCGRLSEGTAEELFDSMNKLRPLPDDVLIYCGHEYTENNGNFALSITPDNSDIIARLDEVKALRAQGKPTLPSAMGVEKKTNIFLMAKTAADFADLRLKKDKF